MDKFILFATPWWVNVLILTPLVSFYFWRRTGLELGARQLAYAALFAIGFGFVEASVVVYLRAAVGTLPGYHGTLADVQRLTPALYQQSQVVGEFPQSLLTVEILREAATLVMLITIALLSAPRARERWAMFLWAFAIWDLVYYAGLWATVRWPLSLKSPDVLFLIPVPWVSQVWYPILVSGLAIGAVIMAAAQARRPQTL